MSKLTTHELRKINLKKILEDFRTHVEFAKKANIARAQLSQLQGSNSKYLIGAAVAKRIEVAGGKHEGWLDINHDAESVEIPEIDLIVRAVSVVNALLVKHDLSADRMDRDAYERILRDTINSTVRFGVINEAQMQHDLFSTLLSKAAH